MNNLFASLPPSGTPDEEFSELLAQPGLRIERIVSNGQNSPPQTCPRTFVTSVYRKSVVSRVR